MALGVGNYFGNFKAGQIRPADEDVACVLMKDERGGRYNGIKMAFSIM